MAAALGHIIDLFLTVEIWLIIVRAVLSFFSRPRYGTPYYDFTRFLYVATEPVLGRIRRVVGVFGGLDLSPLIAILAIDLVIGLVGRLFG